MPSESKRKETLARQAIRRMEMDGVIPKMTSCAITVDDCEALPIVRILLKSLPLGDIHPVTRFFLVPMAVHRIRFHVSRNSGIETTVGNRQVTVAPDPQVFPTGTWEAANLAIRSNSALHIAEQLKPLNEEYLDDGMTMNPNFVANFGKLIQIVETMVQEILKKKGV